MGPTSSLVILSFFCTFFASFSLSFAGDCYNTKDCINIYREEFPACPGRYCGRPFSDGVILEDECQACTRGSKTDHYACLPCKDPLSSYAVMYISFMVCFVLLSHFACIEQTTRKLPQRAILFASATLETLISILASIVLFEPRGTFKIYSCGVSNIADWYPIFLNPSSIHCSSEAVYPLFTLILMFYSFGVILTVAVRIVVCYRFCEQEGKRSIYFSLYLFPVLALIHVILGGAIYYTFPYVIMVMSLVFNIVYFLYFKRECFTNFYILAHLIVFYISFVFAIMSLIVFFHSTWYLTIVAIIVPLLPPVIYLTISKPLQKVISRFS